MYRLLAISLLTCSLASAQQGWVGHIIITNIPPTGACGGLSELAINQATGSLYICPVGGSWPALPSITGGSGSSIPSGLITLVTSGTCPTGWTEASALNGKMLRGTLAANGDVGTTGGAATITPTGTVTQPTLTMNSYTPAGTVAAPTFTGSSVTTSAVSAGTPAGTNSTTTSGSTAIAATATAAVAVTTGSGNSMATNAHTHPTHTHTVPAETFTGSAMATHMHTDTAAGTNSAPAFTGSAATLTGTVSQPTFTGNAVDPSPAYTKVIFCSKQ